MCSCGVLDSAAVVQIRHWAMMASMTRQTNRAKMKLLNGFSEINSVLTAMGMNADTIENVKNFSILSPGRV